MKKEVVGEAEVARSVAQKRRQFLQQNFLHGLDVVWKFKIYIYIS